MALPIPNLDDLDFEDLVEQARGFIPRYASEWTDHNIHDPGITLLELAAWLVDQQIYRAGFVSDRHIKAFAALLGVYAQRGTAAHGLLWPHDFTIDNEKKESGVSLDVGTKVSSIEQPDVPFQLTDSIYISAARFVQNRTEEQQTAFTISAFTQSRRVAPALEEKNGKPGVIELLFDRPLVDSDGSESNYSISIGIELENSITMLALKKSLGGKLVADYRIEQGNASWHRAKIIKDDTYALNQTGVVLLKLPSGTMASEKEVPLSRLRLSVRERINPLPPRIKRVSLNVLPVVQYETIAPSLIGRSNGLPDQTFHLNLENLPEGEEIKLEVTEKGKFIEWSLIEDLIEASPQDRVFEMDTALNEIRFGNGVNGRIPLVDSQIQHLLYRLTLGEAGNLRSGINWVVSGAPKHSEQENYGLNLIPFQKGTNSWGMERLIAEARKAALKRNVLLTNSELENAAKALQGMAVERATVLVGFHPAHPDRETKNTRALIIIPARSEEHNPLLPTPHRYLIAMETALSPSRVLGERLSILPARRVPVAVQALLLIEDGFDANLVFEEAKKMLKARLSDIYVENHLDIEPWPLGRDVTCQEIKSLLAKVYGLLAVTQCHLTSDEKVLKDSGVTLQADEIAIATDLDIRAESNAEVGG